MKQVFFLIMLLLLSSISFAGGFDNSTNNTAIAGAAAGAKAQAKSSSKSIAKGGNAHQGQNQSNKNNNRDVNRNDYSSEETVVDNSVIEGDDYPIFVASAASLSGDQCTVGSSAQGARFGAAHQSASALCEALKMHDVWYEMGLSLHEMGDCQDPLARIAQSGDLTEVCDQARSAYNNAMHHLHSADGYARTTMPAKKYGTTVWESVKGIMPLGLLFVL